MYKSDGLAERSPKHFTYSQIYQSYKGSKNMRINLLTIKDICLDHADLYRNRLVVNILASKEAGCRYKGSMVIGDEKWEWCYLFNARVADLDCSHCEYGKQLTTSHPKWVPEATV
jgi:hypothetical protein